MGRFQKGEPRPPNAGRRSGTPNKTTSAIAETLSHKSFNIAEKAIELFENPESSPELKFRILSMLAEYSQSKPSPKKEEEEKAPEERPFEKLDDEQLRKVLKYAKSASP